MAMGREIRYLSRRDVESVGLGIDRCIDVLEAAHRAKAAGQVEMPKKPCLGDPMREGFMSAYCARVGADEIGMKWLGGRPDNKLRGAPQISAMIILNDPETFLPVAVMDGTSVTGMRTAGVTGIALRRLPRPDSAVLAMLGCGYEGETHARVAKAACPNLRRVLAWSPNIETASRFARKLETELDIGIEPVRDAEAAVRAADIVVSSTPLGAPEPFAMVHADWLREGATFASISRVNHLCADAFFAFDQYYVDDLATMDFIAERRGFEAARDLPARELGALLRDGGGRTDGAQRILFASEGIAINDVAVGWEIYRLACARGIGTVLEA